MGSGRWQGQCREAIDTVHERGFNDATYCQVLSQGICEPVTEFSETFLNRACPHFAMAVPRTGSLTCIANYLYWDCSSCEGLVGFWDHKLAHNVTQKKLLQ